MQELGKFSLEITVIPNGLKKYMSLSINNKLSFIDSFQFLSSSVDSLVKNLGKVDFKYLSQYFDNNVLDIFKPKGFYPYGYMSDFEKFRKELSSKENFNSTLAGKKLVTKKEFEHGLKVWNKFGMRAMKDYHNFYLKCEVLLLPDVSEKFRNDSLKNYGLCLSHYWSEKALSWDAMLNMTKIKLDLISDPDMYIFLEKGMRGGVSYISNRYSKAKYLKSCDRKQESKHIIYLDTNNLVIKCLNFFQQADSNG